MDIYKGQDNQVLSFFIFNKLNSKTPTVRLTNFINHLYVYVNLFGVIYKLTYFKFKWQIQQFLFISYLEYMKH